MYLLLQVINGHYQNSVSLSAVCCESIIEERMAPVTLVCTVKLQRIHSCDTGVDCQVTKNIVV